MRNSLKKIAGIVLPVVLLFNSGCSTFEEMVSTSERFVKTLDQSSYRIVNLSSNKFYSNEPYFMFFYGFGGSLNEFLNEEKNNKTSRLGVMKDVFDDKVLMADYSCDTGMNYTFSMLESSFLDFVVNYQTDTGKKPEIIVAGHSFGAELARMFARKYPQYIKKVGLIAGANNGINIGAMTETAKEWYIQYLNGISKSPPRDFRGLSDMVEGSDFFSQLNTPTVQMDVEYDFYAFVSSDSNIFFQGKNDGVLSLSSEYPSELIKTGHFENVKIGDAVIIKNRHFIMNEQSELLRKILISLKSDKQKYLTQLPDINQARQIVIP